ncbi:MAG: preprotein translocase subunit SecA, partial [Brevinema sp.]
MAFIDNVLALIFGSKQDRDLKKMKSRIEDINKLEPILENLSNEELSAKSTQFKERLSNGETLDDLLVEVFAVIREVSKRTLGMRHFDVQLCGGIALHEGNISEMKTGEGKTLVATLATSLNALSGKGSHLVTVNDYLAKRDAQWMAPIYLFLNLTVGIINQDR